MTFERLSFGGRVREGETVDLKSTVRERKNIIIL